MLCCLRWWGHFDGFDLICTSQQESYSQQVINICLGSGGRHYQHSTAWPNDLASCSWCSCCSCGAPIILFIHSHCKRDLVFCCNLLEYVIQIKKGKTYCLWGEKEQFWRQDAVQLKEHFHLQSWERKVFLHFVLIPGAMPIRWPWPDTCMIAMELQMS